MSRWRIRYSHEADNYFDDNGMLVKDLFLAIIAVAENNGYPVGGYEELERIEIRFDAHDHTVVYERWESQRMIRIAQIVPGPDA